MCGTKWMEAYTATLSDFAKKRILKVESSKVFRFGVNRCLSLLDSKVRDMTTDHDRSSDRMYLAELTELNTEMLNSARELLRIKTALKKLMNI